MNKLSNVLACAGTKKVLPAPQPTKKDMELLTESKSRELIALLGIGIYTIKQYVDMETRETGRKEVTNEAA